MKYETPKHEANLKHRTGSAEVSNFINPYLFRISSLEFRIFLLKGGYNASI